MLNFSVYLPEFGWIGGMFSPNNSYAKPIRPLRLSISSRLDKQKWSALLMSSENLDKLKSDFEYLSTIKNILDRECELIKKSKEFNEKFSSGVKRMAENEGHEGSAIEFLIAEYNEISQETRRLRQEGIVRLNFFITITSSILAVLVFLSQSKLTTDTFFQVAAIGVLCLLLLVGLDTFNFTIGRDVNTDLNIRATGRIRRFFSQQNPEIQKYLTWRCHDEPTPWITNNTSGVRRIVQYILSSICALITGLVLNLVGANSVISIIFGVIVLIISFIGFRGYAVRRFKQASIAARKSVRFPEEDQQVAEGK